LSDYFSAISLIRLFKSINVNNVQAGIFCDRTNERNP
jgi:hypothetical protein